MPSKRSSFPAEIQDVMKFLISAFRIVKLYPPNNPIYSQSLAKAHETLSHFLETSSEYHMGVQKTFFTYGQTPFGKEAQVNKSIAQDLFAKGVREIVFSVEMTEQELQEFCQALAFSSEELSMKNGISTVLWEQGVTHIKVTEAGLDEVVTAKTEDGWDNAGEEAPSGAETLPAQPKKQTSYAGKTLVLGDVKTDPDGFGAGMLAFALRTRAPHESVEDRLFTLYQQASLKISKDHAQESDALFEGLARSVLALDAPYRDALIAGRLFGDLDAEIASVAVDGEQLYPNEAQEIRSGRYSKAWSVQQVATLLKRSSAKKTTPSAAPPAHSDLPVEPLSGDIQQLVRSVEEASPEQVEALKVISEAGMESDIIEAAVRTLVSLMPLVKSPSAQGFS